jgi:hypothetical protein
VVDGPDSDPSGEPPSLGRPELALPLVVVADVPVPCGGVDAAPLDEVLPAGVVAPALAAGPPAAPLLQPTIATPATAPKALRRTIM